MNTTIIFTIKNRHIASDTKSIDLIGDNMDYTAVFDLDEDLASERVKTARFIKDDVQEERILDDNNSCQIPPELLKKGYVSVGVYTDEKSTTPCFLQINGSIREKDYSIKDPEPDVYRQLLEKIEKLKGLREIELRADEKNIQWRYVGEEEWKELISLSEISGEVSPEKIKQVVEDYLKANPIKETDPTVPDWAKEPQKPTYTAEEVGALPADTNIPTKTSELENDSGYLTEHQDISGKLDSPPTPEVGKILKIKSVNEDRTFVCEWADDGSDLDVRIDGQSIVQDGVAEIPIVKTNNLSPGLIRIYKDYGIMCSNEGYAMLINYTEWINKRMFQGAIYNNNLDYAVKAAMTDGKGAAWTAEEQAAARERMGIDEWEDVITYTTSDEEENSTVCYIDFKHTYKKIYVLIDESAIKDTTYMSVRFGVIGKNKLHNVALLANTSLAFKANQKYKTFSAEVINTADISYRYTALSSVQLYSYCENPFIGRVGPPSVTSVDASAIGGIVWYDKMYAGTRIVVKGVRA